jgi:hypothetical protein
MGVNAPLKRDTKALQFACVQSSVNSPGSNRFLSRAQKFTIRKYLIVAANFLKRLIIFRAWMNDSHSPRIYVIELDFRLFSTKQFACEALRMRPNQAAIA